MITLKNEAFKINIHVRRVSPHYTDINFSNGLNTYLYVEFVTITISALAPTDLVCVNSLVNI